jgi:hypothetical protein
MFWFFGRKTWKTAGGVVVSRKEVYKRTGQTGARNTYEVWTAPTAESAKQFLNSRNITKNLYYLVVETPEGSWGKDCMGVYRE